MQYGEVVDTKINKRTDILAAAATLFSEQGYHGTSIREIATASHVKLGSLYVHMSSKEQLLWEIVNHAADVFLAQVELIPWDAPIEWQLTVLVHAHLWVMAREPFDVTVFLQEWRFLNPVLREQIRLKRKAYEISFQRVIEEGTRQGIFRVDDTRVATLFVLSALNWTYQWLRSEHDLTIEQLAASYTNFILRLLRG